MIFDVGPQLRLFGYAMHRDASFVALFFPVIAPGARPEPQNLSQRL
jgi:hypothetical protein